MESVINAGIKGLIVALVLYGILFIFKTIRSNISSNINLSPENKSPQNKSSQISDRFWEQSIVEFDTNRNQGLWARCFTENDGNENKAKSMYLKIRAEELFLRNSELNKITVKHVVPSIKKNFESFYTKDGLLINSENINFVHSFSNSKTIVNAYIMLKKIGYKITEKSSFYTNHYILKINESEKRMNKKEVIEMANTLLEEIQKN